MSVKTTNYGLHYLVDIFDTEIQDGDSVLYFVNVGSSPVPRRGVVDSIFFEEKQWGGQQRVYARVRLRDCQEYSWRGNWTAPSDRKRTVGGEKLVKVQDLTGN